MRQRCAAFYAQDYGKGETPMGEEHRLLDWKATEELWVITTRLREALFKSQAAAARYLHVAGTTISRYEAYETRDVSIKPPLSYLATLLQLLEERGVAARGDATTYRQQAVQKLE